MPAPQIKKAVSVDAAASKAKGGKSSTSTGTSTPVPSSATDASSATTSGRPDKTAYDAEQEKIKKDIDASQTKLVRLQTMTGYRE